MQRPVINNREYLSVVATAEKTQKATKNDHQNENMHHKFRENYRRWTKILK